MRRYQSCAAILRRTGPQIHRDESLRRNISAIKARPILGHAAARWGPTRRARRAHPARTRPFVPSSPIPQDNGDRARHQRHVQRVPGIRTPATSIIRSSPPGTGRIRPPHRGNPNPPASQHDSGHTGRSPHQHRPDEQHLGGATHHTRRRLPIAGEKATRESGPPCPGTDSGVRTAGPSGRRRCDEPDPPAPQDDSGRPRCRKRSWEERRRGGRPDPRAC